MSISKQQQAILDYISSFTIENSEENNLWKLEILSGLLNDVKDVNFKDNQGRTPLHHAAKHGFIEIMELLVTKHEANINAQDNEGDTPGDILAREHPNKLNAWNFEEKFDANMNLKNKKGINIFNTDKTNNLVEQMIEFKFSPMNHITFSTSALPSTLIIGASSYVKDVQPAAISTCWNRLSTLTQPLTDVGLYITNSITKAIGASSSVRASASNFIQTSFRAAAPIAVMVAAAQAVIKFVDSYGKGKSITDSSIDGIYEAAASLGQSGAAAIGGALCAGVATSVGIAGAASIALPIVGAFTAAHAAGKATEYIKSSIVR